MAEPEPQQRASLFPTQINLPRFQFSLWWLMVAVTVIAVFLGVAAVIGALFGQGDIRAFAIGALVPWIPLWSDLPPIPSGSWFTGRAIVITIYVLVTGTLCGIVAVAARRWIDRRNS